MVKHVKGRRNKADVIFNQIRGTGKRKLRDDLRLRMFLFDVLVIGVLMYDVKLQWYTGTKRV